MLYQIQSLPFLFVQQIHGLEHLQRPNAPSLMVTVSQLLQRQLKPVNLKFQNNKHAFFML